MPAQALRATVVPSQVTPQGANRQQLCVQCEAGTIAINCNNGVHPKPQSAGAHRMYFSCRLGMPPARSFDPPPSNLTAARNRQDFIESIALLSDGMVPRRS